MASRKRTPLVWALLLVPLGAACDFRTTSSSGAPPSTSEQQRVDDLAEAGRVEQTRAASPSGSKTKGDEAAASAADSTKQRGLEALAAGQQITLPPTSLQALTVLTRHWDENEGTLQRWERRDATKAWKEVGAPLSVVVGRAGLGCGRGLHDARFRCPVEKEEGDGRSPAGLFRLGTAFGLAHAAPYEGTWPYRRVRRGDYWVDDPRAASYNTWQRLAPETEAPWSAERLTMYSLGLVVEHNTQATEPGAGSAIFLHPWKGPSQPTAGCTALEEDALLALLGWLVPEARPVLLQMAGR